MLLLTTNMCRRMANQIDHTPAIKIDACAVVISIHLYASAGNADPRNLISV